MLIKFKQQIQTITTFLNEIKDIEDEFQQQFTQSLTETCGFLAIENPILLWIPDKIKCENYVDVYIHLIRTRSKLQEQTMKLWNESFNADESQEKQGSLFQQYLNPHYDKQISNENQNTNQSNDWQLPVIDTNDSTSNLTHEDNSINNEQSAPHQPAINSNDLPDENIQYTALMTLNFQAFPCISSSFSKQIHKYREEPSKEPTIVTKPQKYTIIHPNGESKSVLWKRDNICAQFKKIFDDKEYNYDLYVIVDKNETFL
ncbi:unnamed protein product [Rotaria sp. Silwood1]|nr:unnamed protein product [Rotaria sp. Silwood1]